MFLSQYEFVFDNKIRELISKEKDSAKLDERRVSLYQAKFVAANIWSRILYDINSCSFSSITVRLYKDSSQVSVLRNEGKIYTPAYSVKGVKGEDVLELIHALVDNYVSHVKVIEHDNEKHKDLILNLEAYNKFRAEEAQELQELEKGQ